jgi:chromosome segregation ATPase
LADAEQASSAARAKRDDVQNQVAAQKSAVDALASQLVELQQKIEAAQAALQPLIDALAVQDAEIAAAEEHTGDLQSTLDELARRRAELDAIRELREKFDEAE